MIWGHPATEGTWGAEKPVAATPTYEAYPSIAYDPAGTLWVADGPNGRWLSYDTNFTKFVSYAWPKGHGNAGGNSMAKSERAASSAGKKPLDNSPMLQIDAANRKRPKLTVVT